MKKLAVTAVIFAGILVSQTDAMAQYRSKDAQEDVHKNDAQLLLEEADSSDTPVIITLEQALEIALSENVSVKVADMEIKRSEYAKKGSYAEMIAYGVEYMGGKVDISIRIDMTEKSRIAKVTAKELSGKKVQFLTGVNHHKGQRVNYGEGYISVWGIHPADVSAAPIPLGAGMFFSAKTFPQVEKTEDMVRLISKPSSEVSTEVIAASTKEAELNTPKRFEAYMAK